MDREVHAAGGVDAEPELAQAVPTGNLQQEVQSFRSRFRCFQSKGPISLSGVLALAAMAFAACLADS